MWLKTKGKEVKRIQALMACGFKNNIILMIEETLTFHRELEIIKRNKWQFQKMNCQPRIPHPTKTPFKERIKIQTYFRQKKATRIFPQWCVLQEMLKDILPLVEGKLIYTERNEISKNGKHVVNKCKILCLYFF